MTIINTLDGLRGCVRPPYRRDATQFLAAVQRGEASIRHMLQDTFATNDIEIDVAALQEEITGGIDQLIGPPEELDGGNK